MSGRGASGRGGRGRGRGIVVVDVPAILRGRGRGRGRGIAGVHVDVPAISMGKGRPKRVPVNPTAADDFIQATSSNLPTVTFMNVAAYYKQLQAPELRQAKDNISSGSDYGDSAVGYVKVKRSRSNCIVEAKITPQTSVNNTPYNVSVTIDEVNKSVLQASCNCQASERNCKHQTALIFWVLRRSEEPSPTEVECYWKKSHLSSVKGLKAKSTDELSGVCTDISGYDDSVLRKFIELGESINKESTIVRYSEKSIMRDTMYMDHLVIRFEATHTEFTCNNFLSFCQNQMTNEVCEKICDETREQSSKSQWYYVRFGRITASKIFEASRCKTPDGSLVASLMGSRRFKGNSATERGQKLENEIFDLLQSTNYPNIEKCGIVLKKNLPQFGASPDGLNSDYVFEIKCPSKKKTITNYFESGILKDKVYYQIQLQMFMCQRKKGILVIADPEFEKNKKITEIEVTFNEAKLSAVMKKCRTFWEKTIFPILK